MRRTCRQPKQERNKFRISLFHVRGVRVLNYYAETPHGVKADWFLGTWFAMSGKWCIRTSLMPSIDFTRSNPSSEYTLQRKKIKRTHIRENIKSSEKYEKSIEHEHVKWCINGFKWYSTARKRSHGVPGTCMHDVAWSPNVQGLYDTLELLSMFCSTHRVVPRVEGRETLGSSWFRIYTRHTSRLEEHVGPSSDLQSTKKNSLYGLKKQLMYRNRETTAIRTGCRYLGGEVLGEEAVRLDTAAGHGDEDVERRLATGRVVQRCSRTVVICSKKTYNSVRQ